MGCFLACFGPSKDKNRAKQRRKYQVQPRVQRVANVQPAQFIPIPVQDNAADCLNLVSECSGKPEEKSSCSTPRKRVTFDSNVRTYEHVPSHDEEPDAAPEIEEVGKNGEADRNTAKTVQSQSSSEDASYTSSIGSYTPNNRYENCRESDDEDLGSDCDESDIEDDYDDELDDDGGDNLQGVDEDYNHIDRSRVVNHGIGDEDLSPAPKTWDRGVFVHPVLNPIENLTQWKAAKAKANPPPVKHCNSKQDSVFDQESRISFGTEPGLNGDSVSFKSKSAAASSNKSSSREVSVDASLSNWLISSEKSTPIGKTTGPNSIYSSPKSSSPCQGSSSSLRSQEDRPILGALTVEELRQFSATNSPRKSPSRSPDEIPIIGTVGTYWNHSAGSYTNNNSASRPASSFKGIPNTTSKYREDKKVNWHSTPFETRLERALIDKQG